MSKRGCIAATAAARGSAVRAAVFALLDAARDPKKCVAGYEGVSARLLHTLWWRFGVHGQPAKGWAAWAAELSSVLHDASMAWLRREIIREICLI